MYEAKLYGGLPDADIAVCSDPIHTAMRAQMRSKISTKIWLALIQRQTPWCVGSGDTFTMNSVKQLMILDRCFAATGAEKGSECVKVDLSAEDAKT